MGSGILQQTCLKQTYSLRKQLMLSFGPSTFVTIATVVSLAVVFANLAGDRVQDQAGRVLQDQIVGSFVKTSATAAERISYLLLSQEGAVQIIVEVTRDRIMGYPNAGWENDDFVPFFDTDTQRNMYPLRMPPAPLDWNVTSSFEREDYFEHVQDRFGDFSAIDIDLTTASGVYFMQGSCDPSETDPAGDFYYEGCAAVNNDVETGGIVQPTEANRKLHAVSGDLVATIKPLYENQPLFYLAGVWFFNSGAGSAVWYPGYSPPAGEYVSEGCDWMNQTNTRTGQPFASQEEIDRCHPNGEVVQPRLRNSFEQQWIKDCLTAKYEGVSWHGPFDPFNGGDSVVTGCRGIFDRLTGQLIGVAAAHIRSSTLGNDLYNSLLFGGSSDIAVVRYDNDRLFADTTNLTGSEDSSVVYDTGFISEQVYLELKNSFDWSRPYTSAELTAARDSSFVSTSDGVYTGNLVPIPPAEYDPSYHPKFVVLHFVANENIFPAVEEMENRIHDDFVHVGIVSGSLGIVGIFAVVLIVWLVSSAITSPLVWIDSAAWTILQQSSKGAEVARSPPEEETVDRRTTICASRTEITKLVIEFKDMVRGFSGKGPSNVAYLSENEILNQMSWHSDFRRLYNTNKEKVKTEFRVVTTGTKSSSATKSEADSTSLDHAFTRDQPQDDDGDKDIGGFPVVVPAPQKRNCGRNILRKTKATTSTKAVNAGHVIKSSLFWRIFGLIAVPAILTNIVICVIVSEQIVSTVPQWVEIVEESSLELEKDLLNTTASLKAAAVHDIVHDLVLDLQILTRTASWLFFGGLDRSGMLVDMDEQSEDCKIFPNDKSCPFFSSDRAVCPCELDDSQISGVCTDFPEFSNARATQHAYWHMHALDADPVTGDRYSSPSFPEFGSTANTTLWWNTTEDLPGSYKGRNASGYETAYDRIRVSSAIVTWIMPLFIYKTSLGRPRTVLGLNLGFNNDGAFLGYDGCDSNFALSSHWESTEGNKAAEVAPQLCPIGFHGYDARCRGWYDTGKRDYLTKNQYIMLTAPYQFSGWFGIGTSTTAPIANPATGEYVGQALVDFEATEIRETVRRLLQTSSFVISPEYDETKGNTLVGPDRSVQTWESVDILNLLFDNETVTSGNREAFANTILVDMVSGRSNITLFRRWTQGTEEEKLFVAYRPVYVEGHQGKDPRDFSRGVIETKTHAYSVAFFRSEDALRQPFEEIREDVTSDLERLRLIYIILVLFTSFAFAFLTCLITAKIVEPIVALLRIVQAMNGGNAGRDFPSLQGGSKEVHQVYGSLAKLSKVVQISNMTFFSGNLEWSRDIISHALDLFRRIGDQKAIGIACNNLGNTKYALLYDARDTTVGPQEAPIDYESTVAHFDEAIEIGERELDNANEEMKAEYAQQLANRLFNRALLGLLAEDCGIAGEDVRESAMKDLVTVRAIDEDVTAHWLESKVLLEKTSMCYDRLLRRAHGLTDYAEDQEVLTVWDPQDLIKEAEKLLSAAWNNKRANLFMEYSSVGRLQQLEAAAMRLDLMRDRQRKAAQLAMRLFAEDQYLLEGTFEVAARSMLRYMGSDLSSDWSNSSKPSARRDIRRMAKASKSRSIGLGKSIVLGMEINEQIEGEPKLFHMIHDNCMKLYENYCSAEDYFGFVSYSVRGEMKIDLGLKADYQAQQHSVLDVAAGLTSDRDSPAFPYVIQMILDAVATMENDSYAILIADGFSWDPAAYMQVMDQITRQNAQHSTQIHVFVLGVGVEEEEVIKEYKKLATATKKSLYLDVTEENIDAAFDMICGILSDRAQNTNGLLGLTMEKF